MKKTIAKLNNIDFQNLDNREKKNIVGGFNCTCGCCGPSSLEDNGRANRDDQLKTKCPGESTIFLPDIVITPATQ